MWSAWVLLGSLAQASPVVEGFAVGALDDADHPEHTAGGLGIAGGWRFGWFEPEVRAMGGLSGAVSPWVVAQLGLRAYLTPPQRPGGALSLVIGGGGAYTGGAFGVVESAGLAVDLPAKRWPQVRVEGRYFLAGLDPVAVHLSVGLRWGADPVAVVVEDVPEEPTVAAGEVESTPEPMPEESTPEESTPEEPSTESVQTDAVLPDLPELEGEVPEMTPETRVRMLYPVCDVTTAGEAEGLLPMAAAVKVESPGYLAERFKAGEQVALRPAPRQGDLIVVGWPGDELAIDGRAVDVGDDGVSVVHVPVGDHEVSVLGGGRSQSWTPYVLEGHALWLVSAAPADTEVLFAVGSSRLTGTARRALTALADEAGDWRFTVQGSFSPEGDEAANRVLGRDRAQAVADALIAAGVDAAQLKVLDSAPPRDGLSAAQQRRVDVLAVKEGGR